MLFFKKKKEFFPTTTGENEEAKIKAAITREHGRQRQIYLEQMRFLNDQLELEMKKEQLEAMRAQLYGDDEEDIQPDDGADGLLSSIVGKAANAMFNTNTQTPLSQTQYSAPTSPPPQNMKERITNLIAAGAISDKQLKYFKKCKPEAQRIMLDTYIPNLSATDKEEIIKVVNE